MLDASVYCQGQTRGSCYLQVFAPTRPGVAAIAEGLVGRTPATAQGGLVAAVRDLLGGILKLDLPVHQERAVRGGDDT